jgi:hypothetical protein
MQASDLKGYYAFLGLDPGANDEQIKANYRRRAMDLHPDRNPGKDTTREFQFLNEAYGVLSDPSARGEYDRVKTVPPQDAPAPAAEVPLEPIRCSLCAQVSAQPRLVVFKTVKSFVFATIRKPVAGVYCSDCARKQSLKASAITWLLGWWGFPWGPIYTVQVLVTNMFGGTHPAIENARMLGYQSYYFYTTGRSDIAQSVAQDAIRYAQKIPKTLASNGPDENKRDKLTGQLQALIDEVGAGESIRLKNGWRVVSGLFFVHLGAMATVAGVVALAINSSSTTHYSPPRGPMPYSTQALAATGTAPTSTAAIAASPSAKPSKAPPQKPAYVRPKTAPNGRAWPTKAGYLTGEPQTNLSGHSEITIDNGQNSSDVFVKLVSLTGAVARPARQVFIPAHSSFTIKQLTGGNFDVRYRDLNSGALSRSQPVNLTEVTTALGTDYSVVNLTLFKVRNGNMATYDLSEDEF